MTFIIAIQLNDSIIVTADNKEVVLKEDHSNELLERSTSKLHAWDNGIIIGTGGKLCNSPFHSPFQRSS